MPLVVCLHSNIMDDTGTMRKRGEFWEASEDFCDAILKGDEKNNRLPRIAVAPKPKRGRPKKVENETE